jgi:hypothetical protein
LVTAGRRLEVRHGGSSPWHADCDRPVNDRDFDVALHVVLKDKCAHDAYQKADRHLKFIEENQSNWKKVRVFDSYAGQ